jgi:adenine-specific DNA-methyltransferase
MRDTDPDLPKETPRRLLLEGDVQEDPNGPWWFRTVAGTIPDGRKTLVIWRKLTGNAEKDNRVLDEWVKQQGYAGRDSRFDLIYVNGDNHLENLGRPGHTWTVRLIEAEFHRLMFETPGA